MLFAIINKNFINEDFYLIKMGFNFCEINYKNGVKLALSERRGNARRYRTVGSYIRTEWHITRNSNEISVPEVYPPINKTVQNDTRLL